MFFRYNTIPQKYSNDDDIMSPELRVILGLEGEDVLFIVKPPENQNLWVQVKESVGRIRSEFRLSIESESDTPEASILLDDFSLIECGLPTKPQFGCEDNQFTCGTGL